MPAEPICEYVVTEHAAFEMKRRSIDDATLRRVLATPEQRDSIRPGRDVLQTRVTIDDREFLIRVFVDIDRTPANVVTVYRTTRIRKYWKNDP